MHTGTSSPLNEDGSVSVNPKTTPSDSGAMTPRMEEQKKLHSPSVVEAEASGLAQDRQRSAAKSVLLVLTITLVMIVNVRSIHSYFLFIPFNTYLVQVANTTSFPVALPTIQREMHLKEEQLQWIVSAYPLSSVSPYPSLYFKFPEIIMF